MRDSLESLVGKTVREIEAKPYDSGFDGAMQSVRLTFTDRTVVEFDAGSYVIPEEACIYSMVRLGDAPPAPRRHRHNKRFWHPTYAWYYWTTLWKVRRG